MSEISVAEHHHAIFRATRRGDTLIVSPTGSLTQFAHSQVGAESRRIKNLLHDSDLKSLIVDLSQSKYFGTAMVSVIMEFKDEFEQGQTVLCGVSDDMSVAVDLCQLDEILPIYKSQRQAIKHVCHIPLADCILPRGQFLKTLTVLVMIALAVLGIWASKLHYQIIGSPVANDYLKLQSIWVNTQTTHPNYSEEQNAKRLSDAVEQVHKIRVAIVRKDAPRDNVSVKIAAELLELILTGKQDNSRTKSSFLHHMHATRVNLKKRTGISVPPTTKIQT